MFAGRWQDFLFLVMCAGTIFVVSGLLLDPNFLYFLPNILNFGQSDLVFSGREVLGLPTSIAAFAYALALAVREGAHIGQSGLDLEDVSAMISRINLAGLVLAVAALATARNRLPQTQLFAFLTVFICNLGVWVGGYSLMFYPLIIPALLYFRLRWIYIVLILIILSPLDLIVLWRDILPSKLSFLSGRIVTAEYQLGLGTVLRPALDFALIVLLSLEILARSRMPQASDPNEKRGFAA
jgi:hypothetical protein